MPSTTTEATTTVPPTTVVTSTTIVGAVAPPVTKKPVKKGGVVTNPNARGTVTIEVSIARQKMTIRRGGDVWRVVNVSTGSGRRYCEKGRCGVAHTPRGTYRIGRRVNGWRTGALGRMYNPLYFTGGFAIHGSGSVPRYPASHGCVRVTIATARWLPSAVPNGTPVTIG